MTRILNDVMAASLSTELDTVLIGRVASLLIKLHS